MARKLIFLVVFLLSLASGLAYGWIIQPGLRSQNPASSLRKDFRADYALMAAEVYGTDGDLDAAAARLAVLNPDSPTEAALLAAVYARKAGYSVNDLELMMALARDMQARAPVTLESAP